MSSRAPSAAKAGYSSTRWFTRPCAAEWATNCTRSLCRRAFRTNRANMQPQAAAPAAAFFQTRTKMDITVQDRIRQEITDAPVVLFMKGTPVFPQCGFSAAVVQILSRSEERRVGKEGR